MKKRIMVLLSCVLLLFNSGCAKQDNASDKMKIGVMLLPEHRQLEMI